MLKDPGLTALWEQALNKIAEGETTLDSFMQKQEQFVRQLMKSCLAQGVNMGKIEVKKCPKCHSPMRKRKTSKAEFWGCPRYPDCDGMEWVDTGKKKGSKGGKRMSVSEMVRGQVL